MIHRNSKEKKDLEMEKSISQKDHENTLVKDTGKFMTMVAELQRKVFIPQMVFAGVP